MKRFHLFIIPILTILTAGLVFTQTPQPKPKTAIGSASQSKDDVMSLAANVVSVPVSVLDREGRFASQLEKGNFEIFDEGVKQQIELFGQEDAPLAIGIVYDLSGSMQSQRERALATLGRFLESIHSEDEFFTVGISSKPTLLNDFTNDPKSIQGNVAFIQSRGRTALFDGVYLALEKIKQSKCPRRILIVISDGQDNNSRYGYRDLRNLVQETDVQLYAVGLSNIWGFNSEQMLMGRRVLRDLTSLTGGEVIFTRDETEMDSAFDRINATMRSQYNITFAVPVASRDGRWHKIKVRLVNTDEHAKDLVVRARPGYLAAKAD